MNPGGNTRNTSTGLGLETEFHLPLILREEILSQLLVDLVRLVGAAVARTILRPLVTRVGPQ